MDTHVLFVLYALTACVLIGRLFVHLWGRYEQRTIQEQWAERERLLDHPRTHAPRREILEQRSRRTGTRDRDPQRRLQIVEPEPFARVCFIVARDQRALVEFLHKDLVAEEAEGLIEIRLDRRKSLLGQDAQRPGVEERRDPHCNQAVTTSLRETGWAFVRQSVPSPARTRSLLPSPDRVAMGR